MDEDAAENAALLYSVPESSPFSINANTGEIRTRRPLDYENQGVSGPGTVAGGENIGDPLYVRA